MVYYSQRDSDQCYQRTPYHSRRSMIQTYYVVEFHFFILSVLCLMSCVFWLIVFVTYRSYFVCLCSEKTVCYSSVFLAVVVFASPCASSPN